MANFFKKTMLFLKTVSGKYNGQEVLHQAPREKSSKMLFPWGIKDIDDRKSIGEEIDNMDGRDALVARALDTIASFACCFKENGVVNDFGFKIEIVSDENDIEKKSITTREKEALKIIDKMLTDTGLVDKTNEIMRSMVKYGDAFTELVFDNDNNIRRIKLFPKPWEIERNEDTYGRLKTGDPELALQDPSSKENRTGPAFVQVKDDKVIAAFYPYQIVQWGYGYSSGDKYHTSILSQIIVPWKRLYLQEDSLALSRLTRALDQKIHHVPIPIELDASEADTIIQSYRNAMENAKMMAYDVSSDSFYDVTNDNPLDVTTDFYLPRVYTHDGKTVDGNIENLKGGVSALENIGDIYWGMNRILAGLGVPMSYLNMRVGGTKAFVDKTPEETKESFSTNVSMLQKEHEKCLREIIDLQLVLKGILPEEIKYRVVYPKVMSHSVLELNSIEHTNASCAQTWLNMGIPIDIVGRKLLGMTPQEITAWQNEIENNNENKDESNSDDKVNKDEN